MKKYFLIAFVGFNSLLTMTANAQSTTGFMENKLRKLLIDNSSPHSLIKHDLSLAKNRHNKDFDDGNNNDSDKEGKDKDDNTVPPASTTTPTNNCSNDAIYANTLTILNNIKNSGKADITVIKASSTPSDGKIYGRPILEHYSYFTFTSLSEDIAPVGSVLNVSMSVKYDSITCIRLDINLGVLEDVLPAPTPAPAAHASSK